MDELITSIKTNLYADLANVLDHKTLEDFRIKYFSRNGAIASLFEKLKDVSKAEKPKYGGLLNALRNETQALFDSKKVKLDNLAKNAKPKLDLSLPARDFNTGRLHLLTQTLNEIKQIFQKMGFSIYDGPELESDYNNFEALNFPADHPARDMQDTFFINSGFLLRTHTSPVQIRVMSENKPPVRALMPGKVYRNEAVSSRSYCLFHQVEGLYVDKDVTFAELKGTLVSFTKQFYGSSLKYRFRPSFFPFTEPSAEMDITCFICEGKGCRVCKHTGWLEILGCGMVDPNVFGFVNYDPDEFTGYAFGMGIERIAMLKYGITDIRLFFDNDLRFLKQF